MVRRAAPIALSLPVAMLLLLGLAGPLRAQDQDAAKPAADAKPADETKPADDAAAAEAASAEAEEKPIPPEVEAKLEAARRAVAEAIVAAQDAGLVETSIEPPPILDILITGRADDAAKIKGASESSPEVGVSPEVFGAWFTGYGKLSGIDASKTVRIVNPSKGLKDWYDKRAAILNRYLKEARDAKGGAEAQPEAEAAPEEAKPEAESNPDEAKPEASQPEAEAEASQPEVEAKPEEPTAEEPQAEEPKEDEAPAGEPEAAEPN